MSGTTYARRLGVFSGTLFVVGGVIGSGIFLNPAVVAQRVGTPALTVVAWSLGAFIAILGAFIFAELGARAPAAGGGYAYLRDAFGPLPAFLYGWGLLLAVASGAIAAVAVTFANYAAPLIGVPAGYERTLAVGAIAFCSLINIVGVAPGAWVQNTLTILKLAAIAVLVVVGLGALGAGPELATTATAAAATAPIAPTIPAGPFALAIAIGTALVPVLFAYGGWQQTNFVAEEMVEPSRTLPRALILGVLIVAAAYILVNFAYLNALGIEGLAASKAPAAETMALHLGEAGRTLMAIGVSFSTAGFLMLVILVTPRVYQAMARDGAFFAGLATLHPKTRTPVNAILLQGTWAVALVLSGTYGELLDWVTFADWIFFGATAATLLIYRRRDPNGAHFKSPFHPWSTLLFMLAALYVVLGAIISNPMNALRGTLVLGAGIPVYAWWARARKERSDTIGSVTP